MRLLLGQESSTCVQHYHDEDDNVGEEEATPPRGVCGGEVLQTLKPHCMGKAKGNEVVEDGRGRAVPP